MGEEKITISTREYAALCRTQGRMDAIVDYIDLMDQIGKPVDLDPIKAIVEWRPLFSNVKKLVTEIEAKKKDNAVYVVPDEDEE